MKYLRIERFQTFFLVKFGLLYSPIFPTIKNDFENQNFDMFE